MSNNSIFQKKPFVVLLASLSAVTWAFAFPLIKLGFNAFEIADGDTGAKTLFATHYHELTELEGKIPGVNNYCIAVKEKGDDIVFLRKIVQGGADKSYGIQVAKLAGVPDSVIQRAKELVEELSDADITAAVKDLTSAKKKKPVYDQMDMAQMSLFDTVKDDDIIEEIKGLDMGNMTPIEAMNTLYNLQNKIKNRW